MGMWNARSASISDMYLMLLSGRHYSGANDGACHHKRGMKSRYTYPGTVDRAMAIINDTVPGPNMRYVSHVIF
jgi:hypothetical protein